MTGFTKKFEVMLARP